MAIIAKEGGNEIHIPDPTWLQSPNLFPIRPRLHGCVPDRRSPAGRNSTSFSRRRTLHRHWRSPWRYRPGQECAETNISVRRLFSSWSKRRKCWPSVAARKIGPSATWVFRWGPVPVGGPDEHEWSSVARTNSLAWSACTAAELDHKDMYIAECDVSRQTWRLCE